MQCKCKYLLFALQMLQKKKKKKAVRFMRSQTVKWRMEARKQLKKNKIIKVVRKALAGEIPQRTA